MRKNIAILLQDIALFSGTVRDNLKYGKEKATDGELEKAVEMSHCKEMLHLLPEGYDTVLTGSG